MAWDPEFLDLMPLTVTFAKKSSNDLYGKKTYAAGVDARAKVKEEKHEVVDVEGETRSSSGFLWCPPPAFWETATADLPTPDWQLTLMDGFVAKIVLVEKQYDDEGLHHLKVHYG